MYPLAIAMMGGGMRSVGRSGSSSSSATLRYATMVIASDEKDDVDVRERESRELGVGDYSRRRVCALARLCLFIEIVGSAGDTPVRSLCRLFLVSCLF